MRGTGAMSSTCYTVTCRRVRGCALRSCRHRARRPPAVTPPLPRSRAPSCSPAPDPPNTLYIGEGGVTAGGCAPDPLAPLVAHPCTAQRAASHSGSRCATPGCSCSAPVLRHVRSRSVLLSCCSTHTQHSAPARLHTQPVLTQRARLRAVQCSLVHATRSMCEAARLLCSAPVCFAVHAISSRPLTGVLYYSLDVNRPQGL